MFHVPNKYRVRNHRVLGSDDSYGNNGLFIIPMNIYEVRCIASEGMGWEHVSVTTQKKRTPTWEMMSQIKDLFWDEEDAVFQYHPPKSMYVNNHPFCLHLWRPIGKEILVPETILVG